MTTVPGARAARRAAARLLVVGCAGPALGDHERRILRDLQPGGLILFARNVVGADQLHALIAELRASVPRALLFVDLEGGRVDRLKSLTGGAPAASLLAAAPPSAAERSGRWIGRALRCFGFDVDLAPVVDLDRGRRDNALDGRYLGADPSTVERRAGAFLRGLHSAGVGGCLKHFPGLGGAGMDTHRDGAPIRLARAELERDLRPFRRLAATAGAIMVSHASYPMLDPSGRPASLSPAISTGLLRGELGFRGLVISDDLEMGALGRWGDLAERAAAALAAGCDLLPACAALEAAPEIAARLTRADLRARRGPAVRRLQSYAAQVRERRLGRPVHTLAGIRRALERLAEDLA